MRQTTNRAAIRALCLVVAALLSAPFAALATDDADTWTGTGSPYLYQRDGHGQPMSVSLFYETAYGTRESRNFAPDGLEQAVRARFQPWDFLGLELFGGILLDPGAEDVYGSEAVSVEVIARALHQDAHAVNLDVGAGYIYDYRGDHIPRVRLAVSRSFGALDLALSGLLEVPVGAAGRDETDVMVSMAASYAIAPWYRQGIEIAGEDLEGFFEPEESEGGAKLLFGPTATFALPNDLLLKLNASAVYAYVANQRAVPGTATPDEWGFMGRLVLGWTYR